MSSICSKCKFLIICDVRHKDSIIECEYFENKLKTNADRIRAMTDEALAEIMVSECPPNYPHDECREYEMIDGNLDCSKCWLDWLKKEANDV